MKVFFKNPSYSYRELIKKDIKSVAREFEAVLIKQVLKEAYRPILKSKGFYQRMYYDMFLESVSKKLSEAGGVGIARFVVESYSKGAKIEDTYGGHRYSQEREDKGGDREVRREVSQKGLHRKGA